MKWDDLSAAARDTMKFLGHFSPTVNADHRNVKGYMLDADDDDGGAGKVYLVSRELRMMADHFIEVADWLDKRANEQGG